MMVLWRGHAGESQRRLPEYLHVLAMVLSRVRSGMVLLDTSPT